MSGSGRLACEWEYTGDTTNELPNYLLELAIRTKVGSSFEGRFYLKTKDYNPAGHTDADDDQIWYEVTGVITACAVQFNPNRLVQITADFITTGEIQIRMDLEAADTTLTESGDEVVLDQDDTASLDLDSDE